MFDQFIVVKTDSPCPSCEKAIALLTEKGLPFVTHTLQTKEEKQAFMSLHNVSTVPQVFYGPERLGGFEDLEKEIQAIEDDEEFTLWGLQALPDLKVKRLTATAVLPRRAHEDDAGFDLYADLAFGTEVTLWKGQQAIIGTGIAVEMPPGVYGRVAPRSGLGVKGTAVHAGVVDRSYRGEIKVILANTAGDKPVTIQPGDRIAQLILERYTAARVVEVASLTETTRGAAGLGSTGR